MKKRIVLNAFYTIGIIVSIVGLKWAWQNVNYPVVALLIATAIFFLYLKINIVKEVRTDLKEKEESLNSSVKDETT
jgi:Flp pilus assembly protein TadB